MSVYVQCVSSWFARNYIEIMPILQEFGSKTPGDYKRITSSDPDAVEARKMLEWMRNCCSQIELHPVPVDDILSGKRVLLCFIDGRQRGASSSSLSVPTNMTFRDALNNNELRMHDIDWQPYPSKTRILMPYEIEMFWLARFAREVDYKYSGIPRFILTDHKNLADNPDHLVHRCTWK